MSKKKKNKIRKKEMNIEFETVGYIERKDLAGINAGELRTKEPAINACITFTTLTGNCCDTK